MITPATPPPCALNVPALHAQADGTGVATGHVTGRCSFRWHSVNVIRWHADGTFRWHLLGRHSHAGGAPGQYVIQPIDRDNYHGDGYWDEEVDVYDSARHLRQRVFGATTDFVA